MSIPCHIYDIDEATAERIIRRVVRRRRISALLEYAVALSGLIVWAAAVAATV